MLDVAELSCSNLGEIRIDYVDNGTKLIKLWQPRKNAILETTFKENGSVILQQIISGKDINETVNELLVKSGKTQLKNVEFRPIKLDRPCPHCKKNSLIRYADAYRSNPDIPVMPLYECKECKGKSHLLTDEYLMHLVKSNPDLFDADAKAELKNDDDAFVSELKRYVISIFASKKIKRIE